jgi:hypothetical protein
MNTLLASAIATPPGTLAASGWWTVAAIGIIILVILAIVAKPSR